MTTETDMELFDNAISGEPTAETVTPPEVTPQEPTRDEQGRFKTTEAPAQTQTETVEPPTQTTTEAPGPVPVAAVQAERQKRQDAERRAEELERRLAALEANANRPQPQTPAIQETPASLWDDPDAYLKGQLSPVTSAVSELREMLMESRAEGKHGAEKLAAAKAAAQPLFGTPEGVALHRELNAGGNPYDNLVKWHERQQTLATVGNDPQAWLQSEIDKKLQDPAFLAQALERAKGQAQVLGGQPNNAPLTQLPPSLSRIPASATNSAPQGEPTDAELFNSVTSRR